MGCFHIDESGYISPTPKRPWRLSSRSRTCCRSASAGLTWKLASAVSTLGAGLCTAVVF